MLIWCCICIMLSSLLEFGWFYSLLFFAGENCTCSGHAKCNCRETGWFCERTYSGSEECFPWWTCDCSLHCRGDRCWELCMLSPSRFRCYKNEWRVNISWVNVRSIFSKLNQWSFRSCFVASGLTCAVDSFKYHRIVLHKHRIIWYGSHQCQGAICSCYVLP